jgi:hypothetical protein
MVKSRREEFAGAIQGACSDVQTADIARPREWYESVLGFEATGASEDWLRLARDDIAIMFMRNEHLGAPRAAITQYIFIDDLNGFVGFNQRPLQRPLLGGMGPGKDAPLA